jgi:hypothetical protein
VKTVFFDVLKDIIERWPVGLVLVGVFWLGNYYANWEHHQDLVGHVGMQGLMMEQGKRTDKLERRIFLLEQQSSLPCGP